jgi:hypothetical protein
MLAEEPRRGQPAIHHQPSPGAITTAEPTPLRRSPPVLRRSVPRAPPVERPAARGCAPAGKLRRGQPTGALPVVPAGLGLRKTSGQPARATNVGVWEGDGRPGRAGVKLRDGDPELLQRPAKASPLGTPTVGHRSEVGVREASGRPGRGWSSWSTTGRFR